jgi:hypothetical protein
MYDLLEWVPISDHGLFVSNQQSTAVKLSTQIKLCTILDKTEALTKIYTYVPEQSWKQSK